MTQDEIIEMARQAGMEQYGNMWFSNIDMDVHISHLEAFAKLVAAKALAQRTWAGLTDEEAQWLYNNCRTPGTLIDMVEAKLKEKNT